VQLLDRCPTLGGRAQVFYKGGFQHDAGPTVITASFLFEELFALHGKSLSDYVRLVDLDPWYRFRFPDGTYFNYGGSVEDTLAEIRLISPEDCKGYLALVAKSQEIFAIGFEELADKPFNNLGTMLGLLPSLIALGGFRSVWQLVTKYIRHPWLQRAFSVSPLLVGGNPFDTTSIYSLIHYLERKWGIQFAMGGTGALVGALGTLMQEIGIEVRLNSTVDQIVIERGSAKGVVLSTGERLEADIVVSDADPAFLYSKNDRQASVGSAHEVEVCAEFDGPVRALLRYDKAVRRCGAPYDLVWRPLPRALAGYLSQAPSRRRLLFVCASTYGHRPVICAARVRLLVCTGSGAESTVRYGLECSCGRLRRLDPEGSRRDDDARPSCPCNGAVSYDSP
jgi:phytoene desaturase